MAMDPLSITASALGIAASVLKTATYIKEALDQLRDAPAVAHDIEEDVKVTHGALCQVEAALARDPTAVRRFQLDDVFAVSVQGCHDALRRIDGEFCRFFARDDWPARVGVWWSGGDMVRLLGRLERKKGSLMLLVQALSLRSMQEMQDLLAENKATIDMARLGLEDMVPSYPAYEDKDLDTMASVIGTDDGLLGDRESVISDTRFPFDTICFDSRAYRRAVAKKKAREVRRHGPKPARDDHLPEVKEVDGESMSASSCQTGTQPFPAPVEIAVHEAVCMRLQEAEARIRALEAQMQRDFRVLDDGRDLETMPGIGDQVNVADAVVGVEEYHRFGRRRHQSRTENLSIAHSARHTDAVRVRSTCADVDSDGMTDVEASGDDSGDANNATKHYILDTTKGSSQVRIRRIRDGPDRPSKANMDRPTLIPVGKQITSEAARGDQKQPQPKKSDEDMLPRPVHRTSSQRSLLIEYFEGSTGLADASATRPSVRVRLIPSKSKRSGPAEKDRRRSRDTGTRSVGADPPNLCNETSAMPPDSFLDAPCPGPKLSYSTSAKRRTNRDRPSSGKVTALPDDPLPDETIMTKTHSQPGARASTAQQASIISSIPPYSFLDGSLPSAPAIQSPSIRKRSAARGEHPRSTARKDRDPKARNPRSRTTSTAQAQDRTEPPSSRRRRSSTAHDTIRIKGGERPPPETTDKSAIRPPTTTRSMINNPKLLELVEEAIRRYYKREATTPAASEEVEKSPRDVTRPAEQRDTSGGGGESRHNEVDAKASCHHDDDDIDEARHQDARTQDVPGEGQQTDARAQQTRDELQGSSHEEAHDHLDKLRDHVKKVREHDRLVLEHAATVREHDRILREQDARVREQAAMARENDS